MHYQGLHVGKNETVGRRGQGGQVVLTGPVGGVQLDRAHDVEAVVAAGQHHNVPQV